MVPADFNQFSGATTADGLLFSSFNTANAAGSGAAIFLSGEHSDGLAIIDAAEAALRERVPFAVLRPRLQQPGFTFLTNLAGADPVWRPRFLDCSIAEIGRAHV